MLEALLLAMVAPALAEEPAVAEEPFQWTVTVDPLTTVLGFAHVQVERRFGPGFSLYLGPSLHVYAPLIGPAAGPFKGYGVEAGVRSFFLGTAPKGFWLMGRGVLAEVVPDDGSKGNLGGYTSALGGYTGIFPKGFTLSGGAGVSWFNYGVGGDGIHGFLPALHTNVGWAF